ncbi:hypothetical protein AGABI2DRAFT_179522 [Agaricus bisporus var. bisporus H97]|uniref:hypothetical protein n=1 Tax=Agaricus bisporus var. bisporus (strain H97 / ATCC MYA-4626 / FGSC 10389) TaxID=936046 RepID=UPI00029F79B2|nr:hypothetical protein AGABI2DRAFT_179522 [Agaricus bisporus var. bisporus H97]EKV46130.1 hypothetical protein AGABI2DRAFT_179522 [Agaricus bisporus var. bisporus H97]
MTYEVVVSQRVCTKTRRPANDQPIRLDVVSDSNDRWLLGCSRQIYKWGRQTVIKWIYVLIKLTGLIIFGLNFVAFLVPPQTLTNGSSELLVVFRAALDCWFVSVQIAPVDLKILAKNYY